ncbi:MAG TPA: S1 RNA-binding domain-containing protein [Allocoleopsis sp.]
MKSATSPKKEQIAFSLEDFAKALETQPLEFNRGKIVRGKVFNYENNGVYVDIGAKSLAFVPVQELTDLPEIDIEEILPLHSERDFIIVREQDAEGQITLSLKQVTIQLAWAKVKELYANGQSIMARVLEINKGGLVVELEGVRGFIPKSQVLDQDNLSRLVGKNITASLIEVNQETNRIILSEKQAAKNNALSKLEVGQLVAGTITNIKPYGLFVNLDGVTGLIHSKQISQTQVDPVAQFAVGQQIKAIIIDISEQDKRISLATKLLENYAGEMLQNREEVMATAEERLEKARKKLSL